MSFRGVDKLNNSQRHSKEQEKEHAIRLGGRVTPGSGNKEIKGDVRVKGILRLENKTTKHKSFSVTQRMIDDIENAALPYGELPAIEIDFIDDNGKLLRQVAVVPSYILDLLVNNNAE